MATEALKASVLTNLDATPIVRATAGEGGSGRLKVVDGYLTTTDAMTAGSTYQLSRIPSAARLKHVLFKLDAAVTTLTADIGFYYSSAPGTDGTLASNKGTKVNGNTGAQLLAAAKALAAIVTFTDLVVYAAAKLDQPVWQACGLASDPGGYFDLVLTTTATNSGAAVAYAEVQYVE